MNHELREIINHKIDKKSNGRLLLDVNARFLIYEGVHSILPALHLKNNTFPILSSTWAYLHAASAYCLDFHIDPLEFSEEGVHLTGSILTTLAYQEDNEHILPYFQLSAIVYYLLTHPNFDHSVPLKEAYPEYFEALLDMASVEKNIILKTNDLLKREYKSRKTLVKEMLMQGGITPSDFHVNQYIYASNHPIFSKAKFSVITRVFKKEAIEMHHSIDHLAQTRAPIDVKYEKQNANLIDHYIELDEQITKRFFVSMQPEDRAFIRKATVYFLEPVFRDTQIPPMHPIHKTPILALGSPDQTVHLSQRFGLRFFSAVTPDAKRLYLLESKNVFNCSLFREDEERESYKPFLPSQKKGYFNFLFTKMEILKALTTQLETFFNQIASKHKEVCKSLLFEKGYKETTAEKVTNGALGFIPFYDFIQLIRKKAYGHAINYLILDLFGCTPLFSVAAKCTT